MKKINKKGFTLVELLAVVVILGVLLMIAVPAMNNVINNSKKSTFENQVKLALENVETVLSVATNKPTDECKLPIKNLKADRGSFSGYTGYILVTPTPTGTKDFSVTAYIKGDKYSVTGKNLNEVAVDASLSTTIADPASDATDLCKFYD